MRIVVTDADTVVSEGVSLDFLQQFGEVTVYGDSTQEQVARRIVGADIVLINKVSIDGGMMAACPGLRMIGLFATGYNNVDIVAARDRGIVVCNVPGYSTEAVAQHTFALLLELMNNTAAYHETVSRGDWIRSERFCYFPLPVTELCGKTLGIVGYGSIGRRVAEIARAFRMDVLVYARHPLAENTVRQVSLDELLAHSDVLSLHCPLNSDSAGMIGEAALSRMKPGAILINTARGGLVDEAAVRRALDSGHLGGFGADVLSREPMAADCPLFGVPHCVLTPHIAWAGVETRQRLLGIVEDNIRSFLAGEPVNNVAD